ncbi:HIT-like protein, partial [Metschnikowia bicuspidata]
LPENFLLQVRQTYESALALGNLVFNGTNAVNEMVSVDINNSTYTTCLTLLGSLVHRPEKGTVEKNPFAKPEPELTILDAYGDEDEFKLVLNKFPVVPHHFMLITKEFKSQNTPLSPNELAATFFILKGLEQENDKNWFAFFNCGPESGASQPHKHVQFMTLPEDFEPFATRLAST